MVWLGTALSGHMSPGAQLLKADKGQQKVIVGPWPKHDHVIYYPRFGPS